MRDKLDYVYACGTTFPPPSALPNLHDDRKIISVECPHCHCGFELFMNKTYVDYIGEKAAHEISVSRAEKLVNFLSEGPHKAAHATLKFI